MKYLKKIFLGVTIVLLCIINIEELKAKEKTNIVGYMQNDIITTDDDSGFYFRNYRPNGSYNNILKKKSNGLLGDEILPEKYDLRTIEDGAYLPSVRNQGAAELCWAFAMNSSLESYLKRHAIGDYENYNFSENQLDLALTFLYDNGLFGESATRTLGSASNTALAMSAWLFGFGPATETTFGHDYFESYGNKNFAPETYLDLAYTDIDVNGMVSYFYDTSVFEDKPLDYTDDLTDNLINPVKRQIIDNGAAMSGVMLPPSFPSTNPEFVFVTGYDVFSDTSTLVELGYGGHAITIVGWDDTYGDIDNADGDNNVATGGEGAWIAQNSWGNNTTYFYISYYDVYVSTSFYGITSAEELSHDYTYMPFKARFSSNKYESTFFVGDTSELVEEVKIDISFPEATNISFSIADDEGTICTSNSKTVLDGIYSFEFTNCEVAGNVTVTSTNSYGMPFTYLISLNTSDTTSDFDPLVYSSVTSGSSYIGEFINNRIDNTLNYIISTKRILSFSDYDVKIYGIDDLHRNVDITSRFNIQADSLLNGTAQVFITQKSLFDDYSMIYITFNYDDMIHMMGSFSITSLNGDGTHENPFLIEHPEQLIAMSYSDLSFKLNNSINMDYITNSETGLYGEIGWDPISFLGELDGNGYSINGINSKCTYELCSSSIFNVLYNAEVYDLKISNSTFEGGDDASTLALFLVDSRVDNIEINNVKLYSNLSSAGVALYLYDNSSISNIKITNSDIFSAGSSNGLVGLVNIGNDKSVDVSNNYIENTKIFSTSLNGNDDILARYFIGGINANFNIDDNLPLFTFYNNKYLQALEEDDGSNADTKEYLIIKNMIDDENQDQEEYDLFESVIRDNGNEKIEEAESIIDTTFTGYDFDQIWGIEDDKTPRLLRFDLPSELVSLSVEEIETYKIEDGVLIIPPGELLSDVIEGLDVPAGITKTLYNLDGTINKKTTPLPTGDVVFISNEYETMELELAVKGDINRDGSVSIADAMMIADYAVGNQQLKNNIFTLKSHVYAADVVGNTPLEISISDAMKVADYAVNNSLGL